MSPLNHSKKQPVKKNWPQPEPGLFRPASDSQKIRREMGLELAQCANTLRTDRYPSR